MHKRLQSAIGGRIELTRNTITNDTLFGHLFVVWHSTAVGSLSKMRNWFRLPCQCRLKRVSLARSSEKPNFVFHRRRISLCRIDFENVIQFSITHMMRCEWWWEGERWNWIVWWVGSYNERLRRRQNDKSSVDAIMNVIKWQNGELIPWRRRYN